LIVNPHYGSQLLRHSLFLLRAMLALFAAVRPALRVYNE